ncbi:unnamed protein product [Leptosia nina]|uniref:Uncharacterized protein n=1 Tax=Leptosia nina TaxID=320188 RepID=A0AAV1J3M2_9NEOP
MIIDAFEIYGHDPTDKLDNLWLYQNEMMRIRTAEDQVLLITLDDVLDNMMTMYENHNSIGAERRATYTGGPVPTEFYLSQEYYCGKNVYIFLSELYSDIYNIGKGVAPYCKDRSFVFLGFLHYHDEQKYYLLDDPSISFPTDNYIHGLECHVGVCIFRFPFKKLLQRERDVSTLPKAIVKCGLVMYKLPPLSAAACIIASGSFILDFNIQGLRYRHYDYLLTTPNGNTYYTKEANTPLVCDHHVCEWNYTNHYGGPFLIPGDPGTGIDPVPPYIEPTLKPDGDEENITVPFANSRHIRFLQQLLSLGFSFASWLRLRIGGLYWYPQWMGAMPHHPYSPLSEDKGSFEPPGAFYPQQNYDMEDADTDT